MKCNSCTKTGARNCHNEASRLQCPTCRKLGVDRELAAFCCQACLVKSWAVHKLVHTAARQQSSSVTRITRSRGEDDIEDESNCEVDATRLEVVRLTQELSDVRAQLSGHGRQVADYQGVISTLTAEVTNLREQARGDFLTAAKDEQEYQSLRAKLESRCSRVEEECREKLDLAESEALAAVKLLKSRDEELDRLREEAIEQQKLSNSSWSEQCRTLQTQLEGLKTEAGAKDTLLAETLEQHRAELRASEEAWRAMTEKCAAEAAAALREALARAQEKETWRVEERVASTLAACKKEESSALHALREELQAAGECALQASAEEHKRAVEAQCSRLLAEKHDALAAQGARLTAEHDEAVQTLTCAHEETLRQGVEEVAKVVGEAGEAAARAEAAHQKQIASLNVARAVLEKQLAQVAEKQREEMAVALASCRSECEVRQEQAVRAARDAMQATVDAALAAREEYLQLYTKESKARKAVHNKLMDLQGNIRVMCRVRPVLDVERKQAKGDDVDATEVTSEEDLVVHRDKFTKHKFEFDKVFPPGGTQAAVFEAVQPLVVSVLDGYNVCIFAYGQTGSGKTFTMEGYGAAAEDKGVAPRAIQELFEHISAASDNWAHEVKFSMLEIYNETIRDLLLEPAAGGAQRDAVPKLDIRQTSSGGNVVTGLIEREVRQAGEVMELMRRGQSNRAVGAHDMNEHSSRSHSILTLTVSGENNKDGTTTCGKLHLIDLAGSERVGKTDATGDRLKEAQNINRSLSALGDVINSLGGKKGTHVPYRNSKLTFLLQDSLGGNSKVMMFVNISPAVYNVNESICSLNFAQRCRSVELGQAKKQVGAVVGAAGAAEGSSSSSSSTLLQRKPSLTSTSTTGAASVSARRPTAGGIQRK